MTTQMILLIIVVGLIMSSLLYLLTKSSPSRNGFTGGHIGKEDHYFDIIDCNNIAKFIYGKL